MQRLSLPTLAAATLIAAAAQAAPVVEGAPQYHLKPGAAQTPETTAAIKQADADLFAAVFDRCDTAAVAAKLTGDFRFVHDKDGESSREKFLANLKGHCDRVKTGEDFPRGANWSTARWRSGRSTATARWSSAPTASTPASPASPRP